MIKILLVGEARGTREALFDHGFVGSSGYELAKMLAAVDLAPAVAVKYPSELDMIAHWKKLRETCGIDIANVFNTHPNNNDISLCFAPANEGDMTFPSYRIKNSNKYVRKEFASHVTALWEKIETLRPNLVVAFGNTACWATLEESGITSIRGTIKRSKRLDVKVLPTYHPAVVMHQWNLRTVVLTDLEKAKREAEFNEVRRIERFVIIEPTLAEIAEWASRPAAYYAADIETDRSQITMIGFARSPNDALVIPFHDERTPTGSYWPSVVDEMKAWRLTDQLLRASVPKVFQNGIFDLTHLLRNGFRPTMCDDDTMLLHHSLYPEMLKGLGFLGSIYSDEIAWKKMRKKGNNLKRDE